MPSKRLKHVLQILGWFYVVLRHTMQSFTASRVSRVVRCAPFTMSEKTRKKSTKNEAEKNSLLNRTDLIKNY